jgi:histidinol-phosphate aminotransferase
MPKENQHDNDTHQYQTDIAVDALQTDYQLDHVIRLGSNENPLGPSPKVQQALHDYLQKISHYPDDEAIALKQALADYTGVDVAQITLGNGSSDLLEKIARLFLTADSNLIVTEHAFGLYRQLAKMLNIRLKTVNDKNYQQDLTAMLAAIDVNTRLIMLANPNSPTGTWLKATSLFDFIKQVPHDVFIVIDEAYVEYMQDADYQSAIALLNDCPNLIIMRTFSKIFALAGLRFGYCLSSTAIAHQLHTLWKPYEISSAALVGALAALNDKEHLAKSREVNQQGMQQLSDFFNEKQLPMIANSANFITVNFGNKVDFVFNQLLQHGIIVRPLGAYHMPHHLRISIGTADDNQRLITALSTILN